MNPFTEEEKYIIDLLVEAHNKFMQMDQTHPDDIRDWADGIHGCQNVIMRRIVARDYPETFFINDNRKYCDCDFVMVMRDINTDIPYCAECGKEVKE